MHAHFHPQVFVDSGNTRGQITNYILLFTNIVNVHFHLL